MNRQHTTTDHRDTSKVFLYVLIKKLIQYH